MSVPLREWVRRARGPAVASSSLPDLPTPLPAHPGLWLDRCLIPLLGDKKQDDKHKNRAALHEVARRALEPSQTHLPALDGYRPRYAEWRQTAKVPVDEKRARALEVRATSRLLLHPSTGSTITEGSLLLHHTYGVPYLPGSALKGICRARAERLAAAGQSPSKDIGEDWPDQLLGFVKEKDESGDENASAGIVDFWDALWIPEPRPKADPQWSPLAGDVVTPHHRDYYSTKGTEKPTPGDQPIPTHLLTLAPNTRFWIVVETFSSDPTALRLLDWTIDELLLPALADDGIGARTRSGYGRLVATETRPGREGKPLVGAPAGSAAPPAEQTALAMVSLERGSITLRADLPGGAAEARGAAAKAMLEGLSSTVMEKLRRGRAQRLNVTFRANGNRREITRLSEG